MKLKTYKILNVFIIFLLMFITHNLYDWFPNPILACFFPVNESIAEHVKMLFTTFMICGIIELIVLKKHELSNGISNILISTLTCIISFLIVWLPLYYFLGENMIITFITLFLSIILSQYISYKLYNLRYEKDYSFISILIIAILTISMGILTFIQPHVKYFEDPQRHNYGIIKG